LLDQHIAVKHEPEEQRKLSAETCLVKQTADYTLHRNKGKVVPVLN